MVSDRSNPPSGQSPQPPASGSRPPAVGTLPPPPRRDGAPAGPVPLPPSNGLAIAALVVGIIALLVSWIPFLGLIGLLAMGFGYLGLSRARRLGGGRRMAVSGLVIGGLSVLAGIGWVVAPARFSEALRPVYDNVVTGSDNAASDPGQAPGQGAAQSDPGEAGEGAEGTTTVEGASVSVFDLAVGDCFSVPDAAADAAAQVGEVKLVGCDQPHENEVFALRNHPGGFGEPYPGEDQVSGWAEDNCRPQFDAYVGTDYTRSRYYFTTLYPTQESWDHGDREVICILYVPAELTTGSAQGSGQ